MATWDFDSNHGRIARIYSDSGRLYFRFGGKKSEVKTDMNPKDGYYFIPISHPNYRSMVDLLYLCAAQDWNLGARTQDHLTPEGHAEVAYLIQDILRQ
jgi:hypothetical protein